MIIHWNQNKIYFCFIITLLFLNSLVISTLYAEHIEEYAANTGFQLLENPVNPRFIAMGSAGSASLGSGFSYYNPALPFLTGTPYLTAEYGQYPRADLKRAHLEGIMFLKEWFFGLGFHTESIEDIFPVNVWGNPPGYDKPFSQQFTNISLNCGFSKWEDFAFAVSLNAMQDRIEDEYAYAYTVSAGAIFIPIPDRLTIGLSLQNYGTSTPMLGSDNKKYIGEGEDIPMNSRLGITWTHSLKEIPYSIALDVVYRNVRDRNRSFKRDIRDRFTAPFGLEVKPLPPLAIRIGKRINMSTEIINFGVGVNLEKLQVDLSFVIPRLIDDNQIKWLTGVTYLLRKKKLPDQTQTDIQNQQKKEDIPQVDSTQTEIKSGSLSEHDVPLDSIQIKVDSVIIDSTRESDTVKIHDTPKHSGEEAQKVQDSTFIKTTAPVESNEIILESVDYTDTKDTLGTTDFISEHNEIRDSILLEILDNAETSEETNRDNNSGKD